VAPVPPPPHERTWRHPSELASVQRSALKAEPVTTKVRTLGALSATLGILGIGLSLMWLTPEGASPPMAQPDTTPSDLPLATPIEVTPENAALLGFDSTHTGRLAMASERQVSVAAAAATETSSVNQDPAGPTEVRVQVRLMDGTVTGARVVNSRSGVALVELDAPFEAPGRQLASLDPDDTEEVVVLSEQPHTVSYSQLSRGNRDTDSEPLHLVAGTPVVTAEGELLGICVEHEQGDHTHFIPVSELLSAAISSEPLRRQPPSRPAQSRDR
jgi:hypothetical protein